MALRIACGGLFRNGARKVGLLSGSREVPVNWFVETLRHNPELAVFLVVGLGAVIGKFKLGSVSLGTVTGALFAGLLVGQLNIPVTGTAKSILYLLFLVGNGYSIGPQFFRSLKGEGLRYL